MKKFIFYLCVTFLLEGTIPTAVAVPVTSLLEVVNALHAQLKQLKKQYDRLGEQLDTAKSMVNANTGNYGYGKIGENAEDLRNRTWSPDTWDQAIQDLSGGNENRYQELLKQYKQDHPTLSQNEYSKGASKARVRVYSQTVATNQITAVEATHTFNSINDHIKQIHTLTDQIEKTPNAKAAMDLNSRLVAEVAYISAQELKMQALLNQQLSQQSANEVDGLRREALFNQLPEK